MGEARVATGDAKLPSWLGRHFHGSDIASIREAVRAAEAKTGGEIVPIVVRRSTPIAGVVAPCILFFVALFGFSERHYFEAYEPWSMIASLVAAVAVGFAVSRIEAIQRFVLPGVDEVKAVNERAELEFFRLGVHKTSRKTGVLIFVSLLERRVVILADEGISNRLRPETWSDIVKKLVEEIRSDNLRTGLIHAIETCGGLLAEHFPRESASDQLKNDLVIKE